MFWSHLHAQLFDQTVEYLLKDPGVEIVQLRRRRLQPTAGPDKCLVDHPFRVDSRSQLGADPATDDGQQPRAQSPEGFGEHCRAGERR
jgi:hypothetical protein